MPEGKQSPQKDSPSPPGKASHRVPVVLEPLRRRAGEDGRAFAKRSVEQIKQALLRQAVEIR